MCFWSHKHGREEEEASIQTVRCIQGDTFLDYLKKIHANSKCYLFMDKASPHYTCKKMIKYFEDNKDTLIPVYLPTVSPEFMMMEEV